MSFARSALALAGTLLVVTWGGCDRTGDRSGAEPPVSAAEEEVETRVFLREPAPGVGPGRLTLHFLVPPGSESERVRQALIRQMESASEEDATLIAVRAVAYVIAPAEAQEARIVPVGWGERAPPAGWDAADRRAGPYRSHTFIGAPPPWAAARESITEAGRD